MAEQTNNVPLQTLVSTHLRGNRLSLEALGEMVIEVDPEYMGTALGSGSSSDSSQPTTTNGEQYFVPFSL